MEPEEKVVKVVLPGDYTGFVLFCFENGKIAKVPLSAYDTKSNRRKLTGAYSDKSPLASVLDLDTDELVAAYSDDGRALIFSTAQLIPKTTRSTIGVSVLTLRKKAVLRQVVPLSESGIVNQSRYKAHAIPAAGAILKPEDLEEKQISLDV